MTAQDITWGFETLAIHAGQEPDPVSGSVTVPIYQTSTYVQEGLGKPRLGYEYARTQNPTRTALEACAAALEGGRYGLSFASGMAAITTLMYLLSPGDHVIATDDLYGGTYRLFRRVLERYGLTFDFVDTADLRAVEQARTPATRMLWLESPSNPLMKLCDIGALAAWAKGHRILTVVDNTFMTPYFQRPLDLGADVVVHSATKYLGGHSDVIHGLLVFNDEEMHETLKFHQNAAGAVPGPLDCWLVLRGMKTLAVRMRQHTESAMQVARFLEGHPKVEQVLYPGLAGFPQHDLACRQMSGFGGMLSFVVKGGLEGARGLLEHTRLFALAESLGGVESLIEHPAIMTHASVPPERRSEIGIVDGLIRLSVGIETVTDLIADLDRALTHVPGKGTA